jgi:hypothetical protein
MTWTRYPAASPAHRLAGPPLLLRFPRRGGAFGEARRQARLGASQAEEASPSSRGGAGAYGGEPRHCRDGGGAEEGAHTPFGLGRAAAQDVRPRRVRLREVWRQAAGVGVREGRQGSASDTGALGLAHGRCEASPGARAPSGRGVLRLKLPGPGEPSPCRAPHGRAARAGVYSKGLRGLSTRLAQCLTNNPQPGADLPPIRQRQPAGHFGERQR